jgi:predicted dehydrogenase
VCRSAYFPQNAQEALKHSVETFAGKTLQPNEYDEVAIHAEDFGAMMFAMGDSTRGSLTVSQVSGGRKNRLFIEIFGSKASAAWTAKTPMNFGSAIGMRRMRSESKILCSCA